MILWVQGPAWGSRAHPSPPPSPTASLRAVGRGRGLAQATLQAEEEGKLLELPPQPPQGKEMQEAVLESG